MTASVYQSAHKTGADRHQSTTTHTAIHQCITYTSIQKTQLTRVSEERDRVIKRERERQIEGEREREGGGLTLVTESNAENA